MDSDGKIKFYKNNAPSNLVRIHNFIEFGNQCCKNNCIYRFYELQQKELYNFGEDLDNCSHEAKEAALLMNLREHICNPKFVRRGSERIRQRVDYCVFPFGRMCRSAYILLWDIGVTKLKNCLTYMTHQNNTFRPRIHGRSGSISPTALDNTLREQVIRFILELAKNIGEASEGRQGRRNLHTDDKKIVYFLPAPWSIARLYRQFLKKYRCENPCQGDITPLSLSSFRTIFYSDPCKHIRIRSPRSGVCDECALYRRYYRRQPEYPSLGNAKVDEEKVKKWQEHLQLAKEARTVYNNDIKQAQEMLKKLKSDKLGLDDYVAHYTFDFMQNLAIPNFTDMTKNMYFFSLRNIYVFSIRDDGEKKQFNYLYDEGDGGKGANYVISILFYFLCNRPRHFATLTVHLHADNCSGQNKNNMVMQFFLLMVSIGFLKHAELKFMVRGHTHCTIDGGHGVIKKEWRKRDVFNIEQAARVIEESSPIAGMHYAIILRPENFFDWDNTLSKLFKKLPNILSFHEFEMDDSRPGVLRYREHQRCSWQEMQLFKKNSSVFDSIKGVQDALINLKPPGIPEEKQVKLYEKVRQYIPKQFQDDICPKPINYQAT